MTCRPSIVRGKVKNHCTTLMTLSTRQRRRPTRTLRKLDVVDPPVAEGVVEQQSPHVESRDFAEAGRASNAERANIRAK